MTLLHPHVEDVVSLYLRSLDESARDIVEAVYLTGSVALDDYRPGASDIDFVAVSTEPLGRGERGALLRVHEGLAASRRRPFFDGTYLTWSDLAGDPTFAVAQGGVHEGQWKAADASPCSPIAWHEVAWHGVSVRGPERGDIEVWTDTSTLVRWTRGNMASYWRPWHANASRTLSKLGVASLGTWAPAWGVLGVARQRYTIDTGLITSKYGAGLYARDVVDPRWRRIVDECLRIRSGSTERTAYASPFARRRDALDFMKSSMDEIIGPAR